MLNPRFVSMTINAMWLVFLAYWFARAFTNKPSIHKYRPSPVARVALLAVITLFSLALIATPNITLLPPSPLTQLPGIALCSAGIDLAIGARMKLGANWSAAVTLKRDHVLIRHGLYALVRHPIYTGVLLAASGTMLAVLPTLRGLLSLIFLIAGLRWKSLQEEKILRSHFPDEYPQYMRQVKALIPFIY